MGAICDSVKVLRQEKSLVEVRMILPSNAPDKSEEDSMFGLAMQQDRFAQVLGDGALALAGLRIQRNLWLLKGWPARMVLLLRPQFRDIVAHALRRDFDFFQAFSANATGAEGVDAIAQRSVFRLKSLVQDVKILQQNNWVVSDALVEHVRLCNSRCIASQICEDCFNRQKNARKAPNRRGIVEKSWAVANEKRVMDEVHKYTAPVVVAAPMAVQPLTPEVFRPSIAKVPKEFHQLPGFKRSPDWYSPSASAIPVAFSDLALTEFVQLRGLQANVRNLWLGEVNQTAHHLLLRHSHGGDATGWSFAAQYISGSCMVLWPAEQVSIPGCSSLVFVPASQKVQVSQCLVPMLDHKKWEALPFVWRSPLGQLVSHPGVAHGSFQPWEVRAYAEGQPAPLLEVMCRQGFWNLKLPFLKKVCALVDLHVPKEADLICTVELLCKKITGSANDEELLGWLDKRIAAMTEQDALRSADAHLMETDDAQECLDSFDKADFQKTKQARKACDSDAKTFIDQLRKKRVVVVERKRAAQQTASGSRGGGAKRKKAAPRLVLPAGAITQSEAKALAPVGAYIWRNQSCQTWNGKMPPLSEVSRSWAKYGHREAALLVLQELWRGAISLGHCTECAVEGLLDSFADQNASAPSRSSR